MKVSVNIPLIWAKQIRDAGMIKNQALKILKGSQENSEITQESAKSSGKEKAALNISQSNRELDIV